MPVSGTPSRASVSVSPGPGSIRRPAKRQRKRSQQHNEDILVNSITQLASAFAEKRALQPTPLESIRYQEVSDRLAKLEGSVDDIQGGIGRILEALQSGV